MGYMSELDDAIERSREMIEHALADARSELDELDLRREVLVQKIAQAESMLGSGQTEPPTVARVTRANDGDLTLHEALSRVLEDQGNEWMTARELADAVNRRGLYHKRDGSPVEVNQVHARTKNYPKLFEKNGGNIRLTEDATVVKPTAVETVVLFRDDDKGFFDWQDEHPRGQFVNTERKPNPNYLVLHKSGCPHFDGSESVHWTKDYVKACSDDYEALEQWASEIVGGEMTLCRTCFRT
jgi:hypothetical protein